MVTATTALDQNLHPDGWKSAKELAEITGIPRRSLQYRCSKGFYGNFQRRVKSRGGIQYQVHLLSPKLPACASTLYTEILNTPSPVSPFTLKNFLIELSALIERYTAGGEL